MRKVAGNGVRFLRDLMGLQTPRISPEVGTKIQGPSTSSNHSVTLVQKIGLVNDDRLGTGSGSDRELKENVESVP